MENKKERKLPTFELLNQYHEETEKNRKRTAEYAESVREKEALVQALKVKRDNAVKSSVVEGVSKDKELEEVNEQLTKAESDLTIAKQKYEVARHIGSRTITLKDLENAFKAWSNEYQEEYVEAAIEEQRKAKELYVEKSLEIARIRAHYEELARTVTFLVHPKAITTLYRLNGYGTRQREQYAMISDFDNEQLLRGVVPRSIKGE
ncbi:hypothetical protein [Metabacillus endolithicus]|uniref:Phage protein n=1 Tax=Metabacillus endolithicus TaxID=1535204 RepID=A0ABW5BVC9_9BACI|nr:hypothetical protein [Metabacillus endolithicus]UPG64738.1 hypothetical protein MVE64_06690 [Metabacillus endolithicus]